MTKNNIFKQWDYKIELQKIHDKYTNKEINFDEYISQIVSEVQELINVVSKFSKHRKLKEELERWVDDLGVKNGNSFDHYLNDNDEEELEFRLNELYDIGDYNKRVWFGF